MLACEEGNIAKSRETPWEAQGSHRAGLGPRAGWRARLEVGQAGQREEGGEALHLRPERRHGPLVLPGPRQRLRELLQGGLRTHGVLDLQGQLYPSVNKPGHFLEIFFQESSGRQCRGPQAQPAGPQGALVTFKRDRL